MKKTYRERCQEQALSWALGKPKHNEIDGECCPDFSCCYPDLFEKSAEKRWEFYHKHFGRKN